MCQNSPTYRRCETYCCILIGGLSVGNRLLCSDWRFGGGKRTPVLWRWETLLHSNWRWETDWCALIGCLKVWNTLLCSDWLWAFVFLFQGGSSWQPGNSPWIHPCPPPDKSNGHPLIGSMSVGLKQAIRHPDWCHRECYVTGNVLTSQWSHSWRIQDMVAYDDCLHITSWRHNGATHDGSRTS